MLTKLQSFLRDGTLWLEFLCAVIAILKYKEVKHTHWKWFVYYAASIFIFEAFSKYVLEFFQEYRKYYYDFFVVPFQFLFFYWLYAYRSLNRKNLFWICSLVYMVSFLPHVFGWSSTRLINSLSYTIGVFLLLGFIIAEFFKQIQSDNILVFYKNKMFYINAGVLLFYVGTLPFFAFDIFSFENTQLIWSNYFTLFLVLCNLLYVFFIASFIWGKPNI